MTGGSILERELGGGLWHVDAGFSSVTFSVRHLGMRDYRAGFREIDGTLDVAAGTLEITVALDSLDLNQPDIRERMLSAEFLDAAGYPDVLFVGSEVRGEDGSRDITVAGNLTIHGHIQPVEASGRIGVPGSHLLTGNEQVTVELAVTVDRRDFGLDWQEELPDGSLTLSNDVTIEAVLEFALDG
ncbi:MAG: YceI family protein [Actinomycetota bacterium]|nr:YceI family protein [Actinomycetota bacterium]